jgi:hypothetical protein
MRPLVKNLYHQRSHRIRPGKAAFLAAAIGALGTCLVGAQEILTGLPEANGRGQNPLPTSDSVAPKNICESTFLLPSQSQNPHP